jgi:hypothetical protein
VRYEEKIKHLEDLLKARNSKITALKIQLNSSKQFNQPLISFEQSNVPVLIKEYPDLFRDTVENSSKQSFWIQTEKKINNLLGNTDLTVQKKFSVLKRFIYKILKEKHLISNFFKKAKLKKIKQKIANKHKF